MMFYHVARSIFVFSNHYFGEIKLFDYRHRINVTCLFRIIYLTERNLYDVFRPNEIFTCKLTVD